MNFNQPCVICYGLFNCAVYGIFIWTKSYTEPMVKFRMFRIGILTNFAYIRALHINKLNYRINIYFRCEEKFTWYWGLVFSFEMLS
jgi:hypothetical protein